MADISDFKNLDDVKEFDGTKPYEPLPAGEYLVIIADSEIKTSQSGNEFISFTYQVAEGEFENRKVYDSLHLWHSNVKAVNIGKGKLKAICEAVGVKSPSDTAQLHDRRMIVTIKHREDDKGKTQVEVAKYETARKAQATNAKAEETDESF